jgi:hypothetical protein
MSDGDESTTNNPGVIRRDFRTTTSSQKRHINFVRASSEHATPSLPSSNGPSIGDSYLALVLPSTPAGPQASTSDPIPEPNVCSVCRLPLDESDALKHDTSIAHQVCLAHTHPPSALDRKRKGLIYLQGYGWDPDSRKGLGSEGREGLLFPIQPQSKTDRAGIGKTDEDERRDDKKNTDVKEVNKEKEKKLNAKQMRKGVVQDKKKRERLQRLFYMDDEVLKHLGEDT